VTGIIGRVGLFFLQPGQLGFQVAYPLVKTVQLGGQELVRAADVAEESLRHDGSLPASPRVLRPPCHHARLQTRCIACGGGMEMSSTILVASTATTNTNPLTGDDCAASIAPSPGAAAPL
jgi:hypothetical protein